MSSGNVYKYNNSGGASRAAATSKMECFVIIVNSFQQLTIIAKRFILDVAAALDPLLNSLESCCKYAGNRLLHHKFG